MRLLFVRAGALGDALLLRRAVAAARAPGHEARLMAPARSGRALVGPGPSEVSGLTALDAPPLARLLAGDMPSPSLAAELRADVVVAFTESADLLRSLRPFCHRLLTHSPHPREPEHASLWLARPMRELGADPVIDPAPLEFTGPEKEAASEYLSCLPEAFLAVHPGSGSPSKNWPADRFEALVQALAPDRPFLLIVGPADESASAPLVGLKNAVVARDLPVRVLGALLSKAGLYVGNDSGITHLAAAAGAPTVALFGPTDPAVWSPLGPRVQVVSSADRSTETVQLPDVVAAARRLRG